MKKLLSLLTACLCISAGYAADGQQNVALGKKYTLSPAPNYNLCTDSEDAVQLTDGKFAQKTLWVDQATVGWHSQQRVTVTVDLEKVENILGASWSTGGGASGVNFPEAIFAYASTDGKNWAYLGDLTNYKEAVSAIERRGYHVFKFKSDKFQGKGRYMRLEVVTNGYAFCDELEIYSGAAAATPAAPSIMDTAKHSAGLLSQKREEANNAKNAAFCKKYTLFPAPNYKHCTDPGDPVQLTDGKFAKKTIWVDPATVGWHGQKKVTITVDLEKEENISGACWSTGGGAAGVNFPEAIFVYASQDGKKWAYLGDLTDSSSARSVIGRKGYCVFKFKSDKFKGKGRYVKFDIATTGYVFGDELEVYRGAAAKTEVPSITDTAKYSETLLLKKKAPKPLGSNLAVHKKYTFSPIPNYWNCTDRDDILQLTDGEYTVGDFWTQMSTVGWSYHNLIDVTVDLERTEPISGFSWNSAAGRAQVAFPSAICVYVSTDKKTWDYAGDLIELGTKVKAPSEKIYNVFRFSATGLKLRGRYVKFYSMTNTQYTFCDEIEVLKGEDNLVAAPEASGITDIRNHALAQFFRRAVVKRCQNDLSEMQKLLAALPASEKTKAEQKANALAKEIFTIKPAADVKQFKAIIPLNEVHGKILGLNAYILQQAGYSKPFFWNSFRWDPIAITAIPPKAKLQPLTVDMMRREVRSDVINICNPTEQPIVYTVSVKGLPAQANIVLKEVLFTDTRYGEVVASALKAVDVNQSMSTVVPAGCSRQIWISVQKPGLKPGCYKGTITAEAKNAPKLQTNLTLNIRNLDFPAQPTLHTGGWDYIYQKKDAEAAMHIKFMREELYTDSAWGKYDIRPRNEKFDKDGNLVNPEQISFEKWDKWVSTWKGVKNYCMFWGVLHRFGQFDKNTPQFKNAVGQYLKCWAAHLRKQGIDPSQVILELFDEPREKAHYDITIKWGEAVRASGTGFKIYCNPIPKDFSQIPSKMFDYVDIFCPNSRTIPDNKFLADFTKQQYKNGRTIWLYLCSGPAKQLDPVTYHRLQAWRAFSLNGKASFFWQFGCSGGSGSNFWPYIQSGTDYSPYFSTPTEIMHGKQSEAIREGIEDFEYLTMLQKKIASSDKATAEKLQKVLDDAVQQALSIQTMKNYEWSIPKNRVMVEQARLKVLDALK